MGGEPRGAADDEAAETLVRRLDEITGALEGLAAVLDQEEDLSIILDRICRQVVRAVPAPTW
ncbi:hypothetical protein ABZ816_23400 [Actinosynnema sp. NPDC047251]|uniref:Uncharacterized protein n=1 Tax=Saccharothrix espanaensis (strain ATCC 51144 / DSM 44229 / JCM 9112 / NBRC 15066 / NRRL 15764) TaxID=1179773 RepID=K0JXJ6_SACES|nr:hypothetical protein BN6_53210 [Saccharothrix espanaensis DSM 44229]